jgi:hypothetical protein
MSMPLSKARIRRSASRSTTRSRQCHLRRPAADHPELPNGSRRYLDIVRIDAYGLFDKGRCTVPHWTFSRFPGIPATASSAGWRPSVAIIRCPVMKWIASVPGNLAAGLLRAIATITELAGERVPAGPDRRFDHISLAYCGF